MEQRSEFKKKSIFKRIFMSLPELEIYYRKQRNYLFEQGKQLKHIELREKLYPLFILFMKVDRFFRKQTFSVIGNSKKYKENVIYAITHIGKNDVENCFEAIRRGCWWFVGDPCVLYKDISGLYLHLNGCIMLDLIDKDDRKIAYQRTLELLKKGGSLIIFPEGARNGSENLPVMNLFQGTAKFSIETGTKIVPIGVEQYDKHFVINFGDPLLPENFRDHFELTECLRDTLATLKWEIWDRTGVESRRDLPEDYREQFAAEFEKRIHPYNTLETVESTRFHSKAEIEQREAFEHLEKLIACRENAFLLRTRQ